MTFGRMVLATLLCGIAAPAQTQSVSDNAVRAADDAFGVIVGNESLGLYGPDSVRGFSPAAAGNNRIEGVYADLVAVPTGRLRDGATVHIGPTAQGYVFPAPTGVIDYRLKTSTGTPARSLNLYAEALGGVGMTGDVSTARAGDRLTTLVSTGVAYLRDGYGVTATTLSLGDVTRFHPTQGVEVTGFAGGRAAFDQQPGALYVAGEDEAPGEVPRSRPVAPRWARSDTYNDLAGVLLSIDRRDWTVRGGLFRSEAGDNRSFQNLFVGRGTDRFDHLLVFAPASRSRSLSGELRVTRSVPWFGIDHGVTLAVRGRRADSRFGSTQELTLTTDQPFDAPTPWRPRLSPGEQSRSLVAQSSIGLDYSARWGDRLGFSLGAQRTFYQQRLYPAGAAARQVDNNAWTGYAKAAGALTRTIGLYASVIQGLEDGGAAPGFAANANQILPAYRTRQWDIGTRWRWSEQISLIAGYFDVEKPYITTDDDNVFGVLGRERHSGAELSLDAHKGERWALVAGALLARPRVITPPSSSGTLGPRPIGQPATQLQINLDYAVPGVEGLSLSGGYNLVGAQSASTDNRARVATYATVDMGVRYRFTTRSGPVSLRLYATNASNTYADQPLGDRVYVPLPRRLLGLDCVMEL